MVDFATLLAQTQPSGFLGVVDKLARTQLSTVLYVAIGCTILRLAVLPYLRGMPAHLRSGPYKVVRLFNEVLDAIVYAGIFVFLVIRPFVVQTFYIPSESMVSTLLVNDYILANKFIYRVSEPRVGDIFVFRPPKEALFPGQPQTDFIKRIVGVAGDVVEVRDGKLYRNGKAIDEPYVHESIHSDFKLVEYNAEFIPVSIEGSLANATERTAARYRVSDPLLMDKLLHSPAAAIPKGFVMAMGDNRNGSYDSRGWGLVPVESIVGRSEAIWLPFSRWRITR